MFARIQSEWDSFLESVDEGLQTTALTEGKLADSLGPEIPLTDGRSGK